MIDRDLGLFAAAAIALTVLVLWWLVPRRWWASSVGRVPPGVLLASAGLLFAAAAWRWERAPLLAAAGWWPLPPAAVDHFARAQPEIAPGVLAPGRPQRFWIRTASDTRRVDVVLAERRWSARAIAPGLWLWDHRGIAGLDHPSGPIPLAIVCDGRVHRRELLLHPAHFRPEVVVADREHGLALVLSTASDEAAVVDRHGGLRRFALGDGPSAAVLLPGHAQPRALVAHRYDAVFAVVDLVHAEVVTTRPGPAEVQALAVAADGTLAAACGGVEPAVHILDAADGRERALIRLPEAPDHLGFGADGAELVLHLPQRAELQIWRGSDDEWALRRRIPLQRPWRDLLLSADGRTVWGTSGGYAADHRALLGNHQVDHLVLRIDLATGAVGEPLRLEARTSRQQRPGDVDSGLDPWGLAWLDGRLAVTCSASRELVELDPDDLLAPWRRLPLPREALRVPRALADLGDGYRVILDPAGGGIVVSDRDHRRYTLHAEAGTDAELATSDPLALAWRRGETTFAAATRAGFSCASCHHDGDTDAAYHAIGEHAAITLSVRGLGGTAPYLHGGTYRDGADLHRRLGHGLGGGYLHRADASGGTDLDHWLESLAAPVNPHWRSTSLARLRAGYAVFERAGCASCHRPPRLTDRSHHREASLFPERSAEHGELLLDTPHLHQVWRRPRLLHDGRAASPAEVIGACNPHDRHGATADLSPAERAALVDLVVAW